MKTFCTLEKRRAAGGFQPTGFPSETRNPASFCRETGQRRPFAKMLGRRHAPVTKRAQNLPSQREARTTARERKPAGSRAIQAGRHRPPCPPRASTFDGWARLTSGPWPRAARDSALDGNFPSALRRAHRGPHCLFEGTNLPSVTRRRPAILSASRLPVAPWVAQNGQTPWEWRFLRLPSRQRRMPGASGGRGSPQKAALITPPSTRRAAPVVAEESGLQT
jgi:hypothetical protein